MHVRQLSVPGAFEIVPELRSDDRGVFLEWYRHDELASALGHSLALRQANTSVSRRGVVRGVHFADVPVGQAKYVTAIRGSVLDFAVDIRSGSPTFGRWDSVLLDDIDRRAIYLSEGLGHCFVALSDDATVTYLVSDIYTPAAEHGIDPLDPELALDFGLARSELVLSEKDASAPTLREALSAGLLPSSEVCSDLYRHLDEGVL